MDATVRTRHVDSTTYRIAVTGSSTCTSPEFKHDLHTCSVHGADKMIVDLDRSLAGWTSIVPKSSRDCRRSSLTRANASMS